MKYHRVMPRDLFNEANLLKCLGQLSLIILDGMAPEGLSLTEPGDGCGFEVSMDPSDGSISVEAVQLRVAGRGTFGLRRDLNARDPWPLYVVDEDAENDTEIRVFDDGGKLSADFLEWCGKEVR